MLTNREREVLNLVQNGCTNKEIAEILCVSVHTSKVHVTSILSKLNLKNRLQAALWAKEHSESLSIKATN